jgi:hypothetical protein
MAFEVCRADWIREIFKECDTGLHLLTYMRGKHNLVRGSQPLWDVLFFFFLFFWGWGSVGGNMSTVGAWDKVIVSTPY